MTTIALDKVTLENIAQQLQARCDPVFMGQELAALIAAAKPVNKAGDKLAAAFQIFGGHTHGLHREQNCPVCAALAEYEKEKLK